VQPDIRHMRAAQPHLALRRQHGDAGRIGRHGEGADLGVAAARHDDQQPGLRRIRHPALGAVQHPAAIRLERRGALQ
jgi:hypothetical protein